MKVYGLFIAISLWLRASDVFTSPVLSLVLRANDAEYLMEHFRVLKLSFGQLL